MASVDESAITGESAPVIRESGRRLLVRHRRHARALRLARRPRHRQSRRVLPRPHDRAWWKAPSARRRPTRSRSRSCSSRITLVFLLACATLLPFSIYAVERREAGHARHDHHARRPARLPHSHDHRRPALGHRHRRHGPHDRDERDRHVGPRGRGRGRRGRAAARQDRHDHARQPAGHGLPAGAGRHRAASWPTPRSSPRSPTRRPRAASIVVLAKQRYNLRERDLAALGATFVPFSAQTRMSGVDLGGRQIRKGAADAIRALRRGAGRPLPARSCRPASSQVAAARRHAAGGRRRTARVLGVIELKDIVKGGIKERFAELRRMGIKTVMITGDNPLTAAAIAAEAGVDDFLAEATPEAKLDADPRVPGAGAARRDDRRRHQRRARARAGRRRGGDELRHAGREGGRQHGRPRLQPHQAHRGGGDRQADAHDARRAHHVPHRQRRGQVLRHHPGGVRGDLSGSCARSTSCGSPRRSAPSSRR